MEIKGFSWMGIGVEDYPSAVAFFRDVLGLRLAVEDERGVAMMQVAERQVLEVFGPGTTGHARCVPPVVAFEVDDVADARNELMRKNVELVGDFGSWNGFEWQYFMGPAGMKFAIKKTPSDGWESNS